MTQGLRRRDLLRRAALVGAGTPLLGAVLAACGGQPAGPSAQPTTATPATPARVPTGEAANPLGVTDGAPVEAIIFKGGFGDEYATNAEAIYQQVHPGSPMSHQGIQRVQEQLQPRFVAGTPPDVIDNSGAGNLDTAALAAAGQLADLRDLLDAPAFDTPGKRFKDTLIAGSQQTGVFGGTQFALEYAYTVRGVWYNQALFQQTGWQYPQTWDQMLALCEQIRSSGVSPWTYQGKYPVYMLFMLDSLVYKHGGLESIKAIDNLEPNAWTGPSVKDAVEAVYQLAARDFIMPGTAALTHTEAQAEWLQGKAVFLPCGSWLENEEKGQIPQSFSMVMAPTPSLGGDRVPFAGINAYAGEHLIVPAQAKNVQGGKSSCGSCSRSRTPASSRRPRAPCPSSWTPPTTSTSAPPSAPPRRPSSRPATTSSWRCTTPGTRSSGTRSRTRWGPC